MKTFSITLAALASLLLCSCAKHEHHHHDKDGAHHGEYRKSKQSHTHPTSRRIYTIERIM